jgi:hypothetical protein
MADSCGCVSKAVASRIKGFEHGDRTLKNIEWLTIVLPETSGETLGDERPQRSESMSRGRSSKTEFRETSYKVLEFKFHVVAEAIQGWPYERVAIVPQRCFGSFLKQEHGSRLKPVAPTIIPRCRVTFKPSC